MLNQKDILETQAMIEKQHLDIRTITMGISLLVCTSAEKPPMKFTPQVFAAASSVLAIST